MKTIYKYQVPMIDLFILDLPIDSKILSVQTQYDDENVCVWVELDTEKEKTQRVFHIFGTGNPIDPKLDLAYIGTFQISGGALVFHLCEEIGDKNGNK